MPRIGFKRIFPASDSHSAWIVVPPKKKAVVPSSCAICWQVGIAAASRSCSRMKQSSIFQSPALPVSAAMSRSSRTQGSVPSRQEAKMEYPPILGWNALLLLPTR